MEGDIIDGPKSFKYSRACKHLIPIRPASKKKDVLPASHAGLFSFISVHWLSGLMWKAFKNGLETSDLWTLPREEGAEMNADRLERLWCKEMKRAKTSGREPRLWKAVLRFGRTRYLLCQSFSVIMHIMYFLGPIFFLRKILDYLNDPTIDNRYGAILLVAKILISNFIPILIFNVSCIIGNLTSSRMTGALQAMIYRKLLTLKTGGENLAAQVINICSNDMERIFEAGVAFIFVIEVPLIFSLCLAYSVYLIGPWALVGFCIYLFFYPIMGVVAKLQSKFRQRTIRETDRRVALMTEILNSIRLIKMYAWEEPFAKKIAGIRKSEMKILRKGALLGSVGNTLTPSIGNAATMATLLCYTISGNTITSAEAFSLFSMFNLIGFTVNLLPYVVRCLAEANISLKRIQKLLVLPEHHQTSEGKCSSTYALEIHQADYAWEATEINYRSGGKNSSKERKQSKSLECEGSVDLSKYLYAEHQKPSRTLFNISLCVPHGKLIGVCGSIGSGKSSLISAICGDMCMEQGRISVNGKVAIMTQQAWIFSGTLRENILLGSEYLEERYREALRYCCIDSDVELLPAGDLTEIGERGINLSGGQKQRVNLARAVYSDRDIYLLDDPLSAVDAKVANSIFNNCIKGHLKNKTVLLVTHALHLLEQCDEIIVMQEGRICEHGTHEELVVKRGEYYSMVGGDGFQDQGTRVSTPHQNTEDAPSNEEPKDIKENDLQDGKLTSEETKESGGVGFRVYWLFVKVCGGWFIAFCLLLAVIGFVLLRILNSVWLQVWLDAGDGQKEARSANATELNLVLSEDELKGSIVDNPLLWMYQTVYGSSFLTLIIFGVVKSAGLAYSVLKGASGLHNTMFNSVLRSPMSFFDTTPTGRILNRFSRDLDEIDARIPNALEFVLQGMLVVLGQAILVCVIYAWFTIPLVVVTGLFIVIDIFMNVGVRELKRIDNMRKSPVIQHIGSSLSGLSLIRTLDQQALFTKRMYNYLDDHSVAQLVFRLSCRWYVFRTDMLALTINTCITAICIFNKGMVSTATAGLALATMSSVCDFFPYLMKMKSEFQSRFTAVERVIEYAHDLKSEATQEHSGKPAPRGWPEFGRIEIKNVSLRYRPELPLVLHNIEATFNPGQKIGVVGRTGAGKSSLISTLLRLVEVESGNVLIDGVNITSMELHTLRSAISVIPQDPILFQGTIRYNLDPFDEHSDAAVWEALEQSNLKAVMQQQERGVQSPVATAGENFSVGERQLICLTRALLRKSKILLLDEATASVDLETDQMIQTTIRKAFVSSTVITIAHRLNTVTSYDKILVLQNGKVTEFDTPETLMGKEHSLFREMMLAIGVSTVGQMRALTE